MKKFVIVTWILAFVALVAVASAQAPVVQQVPIGTSFSVAFDYVQAPGTGMVETFRIELDAKEIAQVQADQRSAPLAPLAACGVHTLRVGAANTAGVAWSAPLQFEIVGCPPAAPTNLRIIVTVTQQADGSWRLNLETVEVVR